MPDIEYSTATENDFEEVIDLLNLVFSVYSPQDFEAELPVQYDKRNFMTGTNYIVKENGKIVANVGAYPVDYYICGDILKVSAITAVAVHPRCRSKGYMKKLMEMALSDMKKDDVDLSFLYGDRQRYEYFGYTPCGSRIEYSCDKNNIRHFFGNTLKAKITLKEIREADAEAAGSFDEIHTMYNSYDVYIKRPKERFTDIMRAWRNKALCIYDNGKFSGYMSVKNNYSSIDELSLVNMDIIGDVIHAFWDQSGRYTVDITAFPHEMELNAVLSKFSSSVSVYEDGNYNVMNYVNVLNSFLKLKCLNTKIPDGAMTLGIQNAGNITISISNNTPSVMFTDDRPDAELTRLEAIRLLFSPYSAYSSGPLGNNFFARHILPVPLSIKRLDRS